MHREYGINNIKSIQHFIAQCSYESDYGSKLTEKIGEKEQRYYPFIGAGYIHLTWESNYIAFSDCLKKKGINDEMITISSKKGKEDKEFISSNYVANNYAWESAGCFWTEIRKLQELLKDNSNYTVNEKDPDYIVDMVSLKIVGGKQDNGSFERRRNRYKVVCDNIKYSSKITI